MSDTRDENPQDLSTPQDPSSPQDPTAWRALAVAAGLGIPATALTGFSMLVEAVMRGTCQPAPDHVCHGLTAHGLYAGWLVGMFGFGGPLAVVLTLNRIDQRAWRWFWAWAAVVLPLLAMIVALEVSRHP
jgi:hypothetical protein